MKITQCVALWSPAAVAIPLMTLAQIKDLTAIVVGVVTIVCTVAVSRHQMKK